MLRSTAPVVVAGAICALALAALPARALDPHTAPAQYGYQSWQTDSGLPQNTVHAIVQGRTGFVWIATEGGLVRFDGSEFRVYAHANTPQLPSDLIDGLMEDRDGTLWISTSGGLAVRTEDGKIESIGPQQGIPATQIFRTWQNANQDLWQNPGQPGAVWVLTAAGLFRMGTNRRAVPVPLEQDLTENSTILAAPDSSLWLGTAEGLMRAPGADSRFHPFGAAGEVLALAVDGSGTAWAALRSGVGPRLGPGVEACSASGCRAVAMPGGGRVNALVSDAAGRIWIGTDRGLFVAQAGRVAKLDPARTSFLYCDRQSMVWAGTARGLLRIGPEGVPQLLPGGDVYLAAAEDREGDLWLGTESGGLAVLRDRKFSTLTAHGSLSNESGLSEDYVLALAQSPSGDVWVGTKGGGLDVFHEGDSHDGTLRAFTTAQGLAGNVVLSVAAAPNGDVWAGTPDGLSLIRNGRIRVFTTADGLADDFVRSLCVGRQGELWIGTRHGLSRYAGGAMTTWTAADGLGSDLIGAMTEDRDGTLWIGTLGGLTRFRNGGFHNFTTRDGLSSNIVISLHADAAGTLWIGTNDGGLDRMSAGRIVRVRWPQIPDRVIAILEDSSHALWLSSSSGVYRVAHPAGSPSIAPQAMRFGVADGMRISECSSGGHPAALRLRDGELWFATLKGIARVNPEQMPVNRVPPPIVIERVSVDDLPEPAITGLVIAPGHSHYEFDYAGLSFVAPQKVEYRYRLEGFDRAWVDAGTRRAAYYTNLPHGHYVFRVMARNNDGIWSTAAATAALTVEPHFYQRLWFRMLVALALLGLGYAVWRRRLLGVEREFQAVLGERTRIAREIHDTLAQGFVAVSVQLELIAQLLHLSGNSGRNSGDASDPADAAREQLQRTQAIVRTSLEDARTSIWELRSQTAPEEDLAARLLKMAEEVTARAGSRAKVHMQVSGSYRPLDADVERQAARIAREAVVNALRHADPGNILLRLEFDGSMFGMEIRDDGRGFAERPPAPSDGLNGPGGHFGITGMRERAAAIGGTLSVESSPGEGTRVRLVLPLGRGVEKKVQAQE